MRHVAAARGSPDRLLVDTSVWIDHLRRGNAQLASSLERGEVYCHPFVIGEIACGTLKRRREILAALAALSSLPIASHTEVMSLMDSNRLTGVGLGWIDMHLLASSRLSGVPIWTLDRRLAVAARKLGVGFAIG